MNAPSNITDGFNIILMYDEEATIEAIGDGVLQVIVDETKSNISDEDAAKLRSLGWYWEDREVWMYDPECADNEEY